MADNDELARIAFEGNLPQGMAPLAQNAVLRVFEGLARVWAPPFLSKSGFWGSVRVPRLPNSETAEVPGQVVERLAIMLDIFHIIGKLLPVPARADSWIRAPNHALMFAGRSALDLMLEKDLKGLEQVRRYALGQLAAP